MQAGDFKHKILVTQTTVTTDSEGIEQETATTFKTLWVAVEHRNPSEKWSDGRMKPEVTDMFTTRYTAGITSAMGVLYGSKVYEIIGVEDVRDEHKTLIIYAKEVT